MIYLANPCSPDALNAMHAGLLGMIATPAQGNSVPAGVRFAADNGCFGKGYPGDEAWLAWLRDLHPELRHLCLFATAPDVVGDWEATVERSTPWLARVREMGYPVAIVAQNGMEWSAWSAWDEVDCLFIGGDTEWKLGPHARAAVTEALAHGKHVHMGRVNTRQRLRYADSIGCHGVDGTTLTFGPDRNLPPLIHWLAGLPSSTPEFRHRAQLFLDDLAGTPALLPLADLDLGTLHPNP